MEFKKVLKYIFFNFFFTFIIIIILEILSGIVLKNSNTKSFEDFLLSQPKAFIDDNTYDIIKSQLNDSCKLPTLVNNSGIPKYINDFECGGVTYKEGIRQTKPEIIRNNNKKTIHMFGGSTMWGAGSIDEFTIPSYVQKKVYSLDLSVINHGFSTLVASQQLKILQNTNLKPNDLVVFYDGGNDFWQGVMYGMPEGTIIGYNKKNNVSLIKFKIKNWLSNNSNSYKLLAKIKSANFHDEKDCSVSESTARDRVLNSSMYYSKIITNTKKYLEDINVKFFHFFQPNLFSVKTPTVYEKYLLSQNPCYEVALNNFNEYKKIFLNNTLFSIDTSEILNSTDFFYDNLHVSKFGNEIVAEKIFEEIKEYLN